MKILKINNKSQNNFWITALLKFNQCSRIDMCREPHFCILNNIEPSPVNCQELLSQHKHLEVKHTWNLLHRSLKRSVVECSEITMNVSYLGSCYNFLVTQILQHTTKIIMYLNLACYFSPRTQMCKNSKPVLSSLTLVSLCAQHSNKWDGGLYIMDAQS